MTSVEKRHSSRRSGGHRKHSDGGYSDTSSGGSFLDETDREVSNLTDRAFRSLCIGDEAVYNDSDLCSSSPSLQRDRQQAFGQRGQNWNMHSNREVLKRSAHKSFNLQIQQYGQDWVQEGLFTAEAQAEPQWGGYGEGRTEGRVSATFQHSFLDVPQQQRALNEDHTSFLSNGAMALSTQQRRSRSRVSSLIKAFNSEGYREEGGVDGKPREWNNDTNWDKTALMSIQRELSEFSTAYSQNLNSSPFAPTGPFPTTGSFLSQNGFYSSEIATAAAQVDSTPSFIRSSHGKHSISTRLNSNSKVFIHSEYSPFKVWRDCNSFPFQHGEVSGFLPCSEFPRWYETPMYQELSLEPQLQAPSMLEERGVGSQRKPLEHVAPPSLPRSISTSTLLQKASALQKRCESELPGHCPPRNRTQSLGAKKLPSQRPSTVSTVCPDTVSSITDLQQKFTVMTSEQRITAEMIAKQHGGLYRNDDSTSFGNHDAIMTLEQNVVISSISTTPFNISKLLTPLIPTHPEQEMSEVQQCAVSPLTVEHPPVRAESRGATPDVRLSSYRARATSLLFNLKDNRKRVKSTYTPAKFKGLETTDKNKQAIRQDIIEPRDTVIEIPDFPESDIQIHQVVGQGGPSMEGAVPHQPLPEHFGPQLMAFTTPLAIACGSQDKEYTSDDFLTAQMPNEMIHHTGLNCHAQERYTANQLAYRQRLLEDFSSFTPNTTDKMNKIGTIRDNKYRLASYNYPGVSNTLSMIPLPVPKNNLNPKTSYTTTETHRLCDDNTNQTEHQINKAREGFTNVNRYEQIKENKYGFGDVSSIESWKKNHDTKTLVLKGGLTPQWQGALPSLTEKDQHSQFSQSVASSSMFQSQLHQHGGGKWNINMEQEKMELSESLAEGTSFYPQKDVLHTPCHVANPNFSYQPNQVEQRSPLKDVTANGKCGPETLQDNYGIQNHYGNMHHEITENHPALDYHQQISTEQEYTKHQLHYHGKDKYKMPTEHETAQRKQDTTFLKGAKILGYELEDVKQQPDHHFQRSSNQMQHRQHPEAKAENAQAGQTQAEPLLAQVPEEAECVRKDWAEQIQRKESARAELMKAGETGGQGAKRTILQKAKAERGKHEHTEREQDEQVRALRVEAERTNVDRKKVELAKPERTEGDGVEAKPEPTTKEWVKTGQMVEKTQGDQPEQAHAEPDQVEQIEVHHADEDQVKAELHNIRCEDSVKVNEKAELLKARKVDAKQSQEAQAKGEQVNTDQAELPAKEQQNQTQTAQMDMARTEKYKAGLPQEEPAKVERAKLKQDERKQIKASLAKRDKLLGHPAKSISRQAETVEVKREPDKMQRVKTELAKAKAELAKINEKMREGQSEKLKNTEATREVDENAPPKDATIKHEKEHDLSTQKNQDNKDSLGGCGLPPVDRGAEDYERVREKYGFINTVSTIRKQPTANSVSSGEESQRSESLRDEVKEATDKTKSKNEGYPQRNALTEDRKKELIIKYSDVKENHYVYSESSKEFKLTTSIISSTHENKQMHDETAIGISQDNKTTPKKSDAVKHNLDLVSLPGVSDLCKSLTRERKTRPSEQIVNPTKNAHSTSLRALSHKERPQTKQEILTSKIKAHAEKEISAIKEKGLAMRDGFLLKNPTKHLSCGQSNNARQRPPSEEAAIISNSITSKEQKPSGSQRAQVRPTSSPSEATLPVKSSKTTTSLLDSHLPKEDPQEPLESMEMNQTESNEKKMNKDLEQELEKHVQSRMKSPTHTREKVAKVICGENSEKQNEGRNRKGAMNNHPLDERKVHSTEPKIPVESEKGPSDANQAMDIAVRAHQAVSGDSSSTVKLGIGQNDTIPTDENLQIMGIMVTVRERKASVSGGQVDIDVKEEDPAKEKRHIQKAHDNIKSHANSVLEMTKENNASGMSVGPTEVKSHVEPHKSKDLPKDNTAGTSEKSIIPQKESLFVRDRLHASTVLHDSLAENKKPATVIKPAKNMSAETQPILFKQGKITEKAKNYTNKNLNTNLSKSNIQDVSGINVECSCDHSVAKAVETPNNTQKLSRTSGMPCCMKQPARGGDTEPHSGEKSQDEENVHIDCIAIRVVPKESPEKAEKQPCIEIEVTPNIVNSDSVNKQAALPRSEGKINIEEDNDRTKLSAQKEFKPIKDHLEVQHKSQGIHSAGLNGVHGNASIHGEKQVEKEILDYEQTKTAATDEAKARTTEDVYFQFQGENEFNPDQYDSVNSADVPDAYSRNQSLAQGNTQQLGSPLTSLGGEIISLHFDNASMSKENPSRQEAKSHAHEVSVAEQARKTAMEHHPATSRAGYMTRGNEQDLKKSAGFLERQSHRGTKIGEDIPLKKHDTPLKMSTKGRASSKTFGPTRDNIVKEHLGYKQDVKPKPKEKVSIPEISALADYARLKVIVPDDERDTIKELPPSKKEGFIPMIQSRQSRRPVFSPETPDLRVEKNPLPKAPEPSNKMNKDPKCLVFSTVEQDHKRTGMFKLRDKEKQENVIPAPKADDAITSNEKLKGHKESCKPIPAAPKDPGGRETQRRNQELEHCTHQSQHPSMAEKILTSSISSMIGNTLSQYPDRPFNAGQVKRPEGDLGFPKEERIPKTENNYYQKTMLGKVCNRDQIGAKESISEINEASWKNKEEEKTAHRKIEETRPEEINLDRTALVMEERRDPGKEEEKGVREEKAITSRIWEERREKQREVETKTANSVEEEKVQKERRKKMTETEERRAAQAKEERRAKQRVEERSAREAEVRRAKEMKQKEEARMAAQMEEERRAALVEQHRRAALMEEEMRAVLIEEEKRRAVLMEEEKRRKAVLMEEERRAAQMEEKKIAAQMEEERSAAQMKEERRAAQMEEERSAAQMEEERRAAQMEERRRAVQVEEERRAAQMEQQKRAALMEEEKRRAALMEEEKRRAAQMEEKRRAAQMEEKTRVAQMEEEKRAAQMEEQRTAALMEEEKRRAALMEEERRAAKMEEERKADQMEEERRAALMEEEKMRAAQMEEKSRAAQMEEQKMRAAQMEEKRRAAQMEEEKMRAAQMEEERRAALIVEERRAAQVEEQRRDALIVEERRAARVEEQRRAALMEEEGRAAKMEEERRAVLIEEEKRRAVLMEEERSAAQMEEKRGAAEMEEERRAAQMEEERRAAQMEEERRAAQMEEERRAAQMEEERRAAQMEEERRAVQIEEERRAAQMEEERRAAQMEEEMRVIHMEEEKRRAALMEEKREALQVEEKERAKEREDEKLAASRAEEQRRAALRMDALQYYAITSTESERRFRDRHLRSPLPCRRPDPPRLEPTEDSGSFARSYAPPSPAPPVLQSNTSSPALGVKPTMFRVKDNTFRGSSLTKSVKPRLHKSFGEDLRVGSPMEGWRGSDRGEEDQNRKRHTAGTPIHHEAAVGSNRLGGVKESPYLQAAPSFQEYSVPRSEQRPYSRRSVALDEDDSRSVMSNMSEDLESFATSAADLADMRGLYDYERPESACSFSSDVARSLGKPPTVPLKSEKALRRAKRLTTRRIKKELSKATGDSPAPEEKPLHVVPIVPSSPTELRSSKHHTLASPHFSAPIALTHAPALTSNVPSSQTEVRASYRSFHGSPHATAPVSLPVASPHITAPISLPIASTLHSLPHPIAPKTVPSVPSSPTLQRANHPAPVRQYHVEPSYVQSYPLTQRKVLQDPGSGQYFVVDMPVEVKTKTFYDPETGKYVQLNVRQQTQGGSLSTQPAFSPPHLQPQRQFKSQRQPYSQAVPPGKSSVPYQDFQGHTPGRRSTPVSSLPPYRSPSGMSLPQGNAMMEISHGHSKDSEQTLYMDTASDTAKTCDTGRDTDSPFQGGSVYENDKSAQSRLYPQQRDIITMSELEDFMDISNW